MRDTLKRIERLEVAAKAKHQVPLRIVRQIVEPGGGPWNPQWAQGNESGKIWRGPDESAEAFQARALVVIPGRVIMGGDDARGA